MLNLNYLIRDRSLSLSLRPSGRILYNMIDNCIGTTRFTVDHSYKIIKCTSLCSVLSCRISIKY